MDIIKISSNLMLHLNRAKVFNEFTRRFTKKKLKIYVHKEKKVESKASQALLEKLKRFSF